MNNIIKIVLINHSFQINYFSRRWQLFAQQHPDVDVTLLAPLKFEWYATPGYNWGSSFTKEGSSYDNKNYHVRTFRIRNRAHLGWISPDFNTILTEIQPDIVYHIGTQDMASLNQILRFKVHHMPKLKVIAFSMRGPALSLRLNICKNPIRLLLRFVNYQIQRRRISYLNRHCDAVFCHYPTAVECFRKEGYHGPIYMQTQVGVNEEWFHEDLDARAEIRSKYGIEESTFVFGSATRFSKDKGVDIILNALPKDGNWKYLMMGTGSEDDIQRLKGIIASRGLESKVISTGFVDWYDMTKYWNAVDCAIHVPITTNYWEETFSLSIVQAMITKKPVIGSDSGSVPYQIGFDQMIVPENDVESLRLKMVWALNNLEELNELGNQMYERTRRCFTVSSLNNLFYYTIIDILSGTYDPKKSNMASYNYTSNLKNNG